MLSALTTLAFGMLLILAGRRLSNRYVLGSFRDRLVPTYALFQPAGHIMGLSVFLVLTPPEFRTTYLFLICFALFPAAALSSRIVCGITDYWPHFRQNPVDFIIHADRYSAFGGLSGAIIVYVAAVVLFHVPFGLWVVDAFCFGFIGGEIISRLGCHANGCCYGKPVHSRRGIAGLFSVTYHDKLQKAVWHGGFGGQAIYAAPLCLGLLNLILVCMLLVVASACNPPVGLVGGLGLMLYPYCRLVNDVLRVDRNGMGKSFTFLFLPVIFVCGLASFLASMQSGTAPRVLPDISALKEPAVCAFLAIEFVLLVMVYGGSVEFTQKDRAATEAAAAGTLMVRDSQLVQPE